MQSTIRPTEFLDYTTSTVRGFVHKVLDGDGRSQRDKAVRLYYAVRDGIRYDPYSADLSRTGLRASTVLSEGKGFCLHKSILYAAAVRSEGIPSRLAFADVRNHLASARLRQLAGSDIFRYHTLVSIQLDGRWIKVTPVFNKLLCKLYRIPPLEFDGVTDSLHQASNDQGHRHLEFVRQHGEFDDLPYQRVVGGLRRAHPRLFGAPATVSRSLTTEGRP